MSKGWLVAGLGLVFTCVGFAANAQTFSTRAMRASDEARWERAIVQRYADHHKCTGVGAPAWGRASMARWNAAHRQHPSWN
jgi:hypothetical protein